ncbi:MAG: hypothetical protein KDA74_24575, partial [Planctomycetaceae bacterium]|nr:hypothetical protein [Planctomycetaceae bacterium]
MSNQKQRPLMLRAEAFPVPRTSELTHHQHLGLRQLLLRLQEAVEYLDLHAESPTVPAWLSNERYMRLAFVNGRRGTGKTTLMTTLVRLIVPDPSSNYIENFNDMDQNESLSDLARPLHNRIVVLDPLDMEPLPKSTPILAAIMARLSRAARDFETGNKTPRGLLDPTLDDDRDFIRFQQFQAQIARALDSNLVDRRGSLDREQYGQAVMEQENDRLRIWPTLNDVLKHLSKAIGSDQNNRKRHLFLVPVDDVDLNPKRCLELLRLLRSYSPPQLFFLLMGQFDLVKSIVKLSMAKEYDEIRAHKSEYSGATDKVLQREIAEVSAANLQKMVPNVIELPPLSIDDIMRFRPPGQNRTKKSLRELFTEVTFEKNNALPAKVTNLYELLIFNRVQSNSGKRMSSGFQLSEYPGLGAFRVSLRRLVDLSMHLEEALQEEKLEINSEESG